MKPASAEGSAKREYWDTTGKSHPASVGCEHCDGERSPLVRIDRLRGHVCPPCDVILDEMYPPRRATASAPVGRQEGITVNASRRVLDEVAAELASARAKFNALNSSHEGYAVLAEEVDELWDLVKLNPKKHPLATGGTPEERATDGERRRRADMRAEAIQIAAMAIRFAEDVCDE